MLAGFDAARGETERAAARLEEALAHAREVSNPELTLAATVEWARLTGGHTDEALEALAALEERVAHSERMDARFRLWELTRDREHLEEAHRLLAHVRAHAPEQDHDSMIENVPLYRDITKAWETQGAA